MPAARRLHYGRLDARPEETAVVGGITLGAQQPAAVTASQATQQLLAIRALDVNQRIALPLHDPARAALGERLAACYRAEEPQADPATAAGWTGFFTQAPVVVILVSHPSDARPVPEWEQRLSCGAAGFALLAAAHMSGFAGQWLTGWPAYSQRFAQVLGLGPDDRIAGFYFLGTARRTPSERPRPTEEDVVRRLRTPADVAALGSGSDAIPPPA